MAGSPPTGGVGGTTRRAKESRAMPRTTPPSVGLTTRRSGATLPWRGMETSIFGSSIACCASCTPSRTRARNTRCFRHESVVPCVRHMSRKVAAMLVATNPKELPPAISTSSEFVQKLPSICPIIVGQLPMTRNSEQRRPNMVVYGPHVGRLGQTFAPNGVGFGQDSAGATFPHVQGQLFGKR